MMNDPPEKNIRLTDPQEKDLWDDMMRDVTPLPKPSSTPKPKEQVSRARSSALGAGERAGVEDKRNVHQSPPTPPSSPHAPQLDHRTEARLRKGKIKINLTLDLHGLNQAEAHASLNQAVSRAYHDGMRCLLIITGKGNKEGHHNPFSSGHRGVLKQRVPQWLDQEPLKSMILKSQAARPQHGGAGALYLYIKRKRGD